MRALSALAPLLVLGCAHTAPAPRPDAPAPAWPLPPAAALVRYEGTFPDARFAPAPPSLPVRVLRAIVGLGEDAARPDVALARPFGLAPLPSGFAVADPDAPAVVRVDWSAGRAEAVTCEDRPWRQPIAIASSPDGALFVADAGARAVLRISADGCKALGEGAFERPSGVAFSGGRVYVVDPPRHVVVALGVDGRELQRFGGRGSGPGELNFPTGVTALGDGTLLVVDALNFRVARFSPDGAFLSAFGAPGDGGGAFGRPRAAAVDARGRTYVTDAQHDVVVVFGADGRFELAVGGSGDGPGELTLPAGLALGDGRLYVADSWNHRVQVYALAAEGSP